MKISRISPILIYLFILILVNNVIVFGFVEVNNNGELLIDGRNYTNLINESYTFGTNIWHTRYIKNNVQIPISEIWKTKPMHIKKGSNSTGQPIILEDTIIATSGDYIYVINKKDGSIIPQGKDQGIRLQQNNSINKSLYSSPLYLSNDDGWLDDDHLPRIFVGTRTDGKMYCYKMNEDRQLIYQWQFQTDMNKPNSGGIVSSPTVAFDRMDIKKTYIVFGNEEGYLYVLNARTGDLIQNGKVYIGGKISSSPISYIDGDKRFSNIAVGVNKLDKGFLYGGYIKNYSFYQHEFLTEKIYSNEIKSHGIPSSLSLGIYEEGMSYYFLYSDKKGNIFCYNQKIDDEEGDKRSKLLFKITSFNGNQSLNTPTIVDNRYGIFTFNSGGRCKVVCIDIRKAISEGKNHTNRLANNSINWVSKPEDSHGPAYIGATAISVEDSNKKVDIVIVGDEGRDKSKNNIRAYYVEDSIEGRPIPVTNAFNSDNNFQWGGVKSEPAFADDIFVVMDGLGVLHAYSLRPLNNLSIKNLTNSRDKAELGAEYELKFDVKSTCEDTIEGVDVRLLGFGGLIETRKVDIPKEGRSITFKYTVPEDYVFNNINLLVEINMENRVIEESTYKDNRDGLEIDINNGIDLEVVSIEDTTFYPGITSPIRVKVKNNSSKNLRDIDFAISINDLLMQEKKINLGAYDEGFVSFRLNTPLEICEFKLGAEINPNKNIIEYTYDNNYKSIPCRVMYTKPPKSCKEEVRWTETRFSHYKIKKEYYYDENGEKKNRQKKISIFKEKEFYARLLLSGRVSHKKIKSGYGIELEVDTDIRHNYDNEDAIIGIQRVLAYFPDLEEPIELICNGNKTSLTNSWVLPINQDSVLNKRNHYIPVNWPNGDYEIIIKAFESATPGGKPCLKMTLVVDVDGHMYMDDVTS